MSFISRGLRFLRFHAQRLFLRGSDMRAAQQSLLSDDSYTAEERELLSRVSTAVHRSDAMYRPPHGKHYLQVGLSALRCIERARQSIPEPTPVQSILDLPCGYGRVLRLLQARWPEATIIGSDLLVPGMAFCRREFGIETVPSNTDLTQVTLPRKFDLIWCGSLVTHLDAEAIAQLLLFFRQQLAPGGLCVFTAHGQHSVELLEQRVVTYSLTSAAQERLLTQVASQGHGYQDYAAHTGYGISIVLPEEMERMAKAAGDWQQACFLPRGWDNHQDVYGYAAPNA